MTDTDMRGLDRIPKWWPVVVAFVVVIAAGVRVQAQGDETRASVADLSSRLRAEEAVSADFRERMARVEAQGAETLRAVHRIEARMDGR